MNKRTIWVLGVVVALLSAGAFYFLRKENDVVDKTMGVYTHTTSSGKKITIQDAHPEGKDRSMAIIVTEGFENNTPVALKKDKLTSVYFADLNNDEADEVVLVFTSQASTTSSEAIVYTTFDNSALLAIDIPTITEEDMSPGKLFEGYVGGDTFFIEKNRLFRTFLATLRENESAPTPPGEGPLTPPSGQEEPNQPLTSDLPQSEGLDLPPESTTTDATSTPAVAATERRTITYTLTGSEGVFSFEPQALEGVKQLTASTTATLSSTSWKWLSLNNKGVIVSPPGEDPLILSFAEDGTFSASTTCEVFAGGYVATTNVLRLGSLVVSPHEGTTPCPTQVSTLKDLLPNIESFVIREDQLMLTIGQNDGVILFIRQ